VIEKSFLPFLFLPLFLFSPLPEKVRSEDVPFFVNTPMKPERMLRCFFSLCSEEEGPYPLFPPPFSSMNE